MEILIGWLGLSLVVAVAATKRGRIGVGWFIISLFLSPLIGGLLLLALGPSGTAAAPRDDSGAPITSRTHVRCPECRELVRADARLCKHCRTVLVPQQPT